MAADIRPIPLPAVAPHVPPARPHVPLHSRLYGLGSVFGKTLRDGRFPALAMLAILGALVVGGGLAMASTYGTPETRRELAIMSASMPPELRGFYGNPVNVDTLGGFISWHYGAYLALLTGLWSILALSSTIAGEARRGSLEFTAATPHSRRGIAFEKVAGHVAALAISMAILGFLVSMTSTLFGTMPEDAISPAAAAAFAVGVGLRALIAGSVAFALAPLLGRGVAAGVAGVVMVGGYVVNGYRTVVPAFDTLANATWFSWGAGHIPLAGQYDWAGVAVIAVVGALLLAVGVEGFARRDVGGTISVPLPGLPRLLLGVHGPVGRSLGDLLPASVSWGVGLGVYGLLMVTASRALLDLLGQSPQLSEIFRTLIPGIDLTSVAGFLQLALADFGFILLGLAAATFVAVRSADESVGRLELQLTTPLSRARWSIATGIAVWLAILVATALFAISIAAGVALIGQDPATPAVGTVALAVYGAGLAGIGIAVGGWFGPRFAASVVAGVTIVTFMIDLLAPMLQLPDWVAELALTSHMGEPFVGAWDVGGLAACLLLAVGGLLLGAWGMHRRDVNA